MGIFRRPESRLLRRERRIMRMRPHWLSQWRVLGETLLVELVTYLLHIAIPDDVWLLQSLVWYAALFAIFRLGYHIWWWWEDITMFTDRRVLRVQGLIKQVDEMTPTKKITDMKFGNTFWGAILGWGWFRIESAGTAGLEYYPYVADLQAVQEVLSGLVFGDPDSKSEGLPPPRHGPEQPDTTPMDALDTHWLDTTDD